jgi:drug/metabolite transporter superfamily protein YnfA
MQTIRNTHNRVFFKISLVAFLVCLVSAAIFLFNLLNTQKREALLALDAMQVEAKGEAAELASSLRALEPLVEQIAADLAVGKLTVSEIDQRLRRDLGNNSWMYGLGLAFEPYQASGGDRLWSRNYTVGEDRLIRGHRLDFDYTDKEHDWYRKPLLEGSYWNEPYFSRADKTLVTEYGVPFWLPGKTKGVDAASGVVYGNLSVSKIKRLVDFDNQHISYYYLLSQQGRYIVHPDQRRVLSGETIFEYARELRDKPLNLMAEHSVSGGNGYIFHVDPITGAETWMIYEPMKTSGWSLVVAIDNSRLIDQDNTRRQWYLLIILATVTMILFVAVVCLRKPLSPGRLLKASLIASIFIFSAVVLLWVVEGEYPKQTDNNDELRVMSTDALNDFKRSQIEVANARHLPLPRFIETGVYLQSIEFEDANNVQISAYVWQHYLKNEHKGIARGFVLPEAEAPVIEEVYRDRSDPSDPGCLNEDISLRDCEEVVGWYISATLRQEFDYSLFPLDSQQVWLRIWHKSFRENIVLIPFFESYAFLNPKLAPGIQHDFVLPGWDIEESWFSLNDLVFDTNFGNRNIQGLQHKSELYYNVNIRRQFLGPFVSTLIPVVVISMLMYLLVLISTKSSKASEWLGFTANDVVLGLSALFFVAALNHSELRQSLKSSNIMYFEYFYLVIYIMLLYVAVSSVFIAKNEAIEGVDENFKEKFLYWPVLSIALFLITFLVFF